MKDECTACALCGTEQLEKNHRQNLDYILQFNGLERDDAYKRIAIQNIKSHPAKFLRNCFANQSRLWFGIPNSYHAEQDATILKFLPNVFLLTCFLIGLPLWCYNFKSVPSEISLLMFFLLLYLILSTIVSVYMRQFCVIVPIILLWLSVIFSRTMTIQIKFEE